MTDDPNRDERASQREPLASEEMLPLVYEELRKLARARMAKEKPGQTLTPTGLVHEAYLRLVRSGDPTWENRGHFFAAAAEAMRRILIERARRYASKKRGADLARVTLDEALLGIIPESETLIALDEALTRLEALDEDMAAVVKLHQYAGLSLEETGAALGISERTVRRRWTAARAWLRRELSRQPADAV